jgi:hypothetical protein
MQISMSQDNDTFQALIEQDLKGSTRDFEHNLMHAFFPWWQNGFPVITPRPICLSFEQTLDLFSH